MYKVYWSKRSKKDLAKLEKNLIKRIIEKVEGIKSVPYHFLERLTDRPGWRLRVGDYIVFIDINEKEKTLEIIHIEHRKKAYKNK